MALKLGALWMDRVAELRCEPTRKRVRATLGGRTAFDTTRAILVWEPHRVVPAYAVHIDDLRHDLFEMTIATDDGRLRGTDVPLESGGRQVLKHGPFRLHTTDGKELTLRCDGIERAGGAFRPADPDLAGYVILDFDAFDAWLEEDEVIRGHPRDPFHRIDVRKSSRHVRVELDGERIAESSEPRIVFETKLPPRVYLRREDVRNELLRPSPKRTICAYKGDASYVTLVLGDRVVENVAWSYERPLPDAPEIAGLLSFYDHHVDILVDGVRGAFDS